MNEIGVRWRGPRSIIIQSSFPPIEFGDATGAAQQSEADYQDRRRQKLLHVSSFGRPERFR